MNLYHLMKKRRTVRNFKNDTIPEGFVQKLLDVANNAPSGGNIQPLSIILVKDNNRKKELAKIVGDQPWVENAPLSMIMCIDFFRIKKWASTCDTIFRGENALSHFLIAYADIMCAAQNIVILADYLGLGSVYIGTIQSNIDETREYFQIPKYVLPMILLSIGFPKSIPKTIPKLKKDVIVHNEIYRELSDKKIIDAFEDKYGAFGDNMEKYFNRAYVEAVEAEKQQNISWITQAKEKINKLQIKNNAQFLFNYRYPSNEMVQMNKSIIQSFKNAGFSFWKT